MGRLFLAPRVPPHLDTDLLGQRRFDTQQVGQNVAIAALHAAGLVDPDLGRVDPMTSP